MIGTRKLMLIVFVEASPILAYYVNFETVWELAPNRSLLLFIL